METYTYKFADGTKCTVEVADELHKLLEQLDKDEYNNWQRENRRHVSLDGLRDNGIDIPIYDAYTFGELIADLQNDELSDVIQNLGKKQKELLYAVFYERKKLKEIAREQKVTSAERHISSAGISTAIKTLISPCRALLRNRLLKIRGDVMKQKNYIAGLYFRLSQEDERQGESVSIENQRTMLRKYAEEHGFEIHGEYIDDGISGTTFDRPEVQRLLDDAKTGAINTIIVKDLSRFGRNYIEVGQYVDYVFPAFGIRFIAIQDNVDTANRDSGAMEMMPIMNVFNEWHAVNTSKKIRAVKRAHAIEGKFSGSRTPYGYLKGTDEKRTFQIDEETAPTVRRIFEMYASGISPQRIAEIFNEEDIPSAGRLAFLRTGRKYNNNEHPYWEQATIRPILRNIAYIGHLAQQKTSAISYKNHRLIRKDRSDWVIVHNTHEPIISQELWDRVQDRMSSQSHGRKMHTGITHPLSGFLYCADCGAKLKMGYVWDKSINDYRYNFN